MPKRLPIAVPTPRNVDTATQVFGSELRVQLLRFYAVTPSRQAEAVRALGVERPVVQSNTAALAKLGVLVRHRDRSYSVDRKQVRELLRALEAFQLPPETE